MSSFIGHGLAAVGVYTARPTSGSQRASILWLVWLVLLSWSPDVDYVLTVLRINGARVTHSFAFCLILPTFTTIVLLIMRTPSSRTLFAQAYAANLSHIALDLLVGVTPLPLLWPISFTTFRLPFGILPSAGRISLDNPLLYRNTVIELGITLPLVVSVYLARRKASIYWHIGLLFISLCFAIWAFTLSR